MTVICNSTKGKRGFSIIEALLAFVILLIAIGGLFSAGAIYGTGTSSFAFGNIKRNSIEVQATTAAQQYMDELRDAVRMNLPLPGPLTTVPVSSGQSFLSSSVPAAKLGNFYISNDGCPPAASSMAFRVCTVTVRPTSTTNVTVLNVPIAVTSDVTQQTQT